MNMIVKMLHGSHLYGLSTPNSDQDWKGIFLPPLNEVLLTGPDKHARQTTKEGDGKNTKDDVDEVYFSLVNFVNMAKRGEMIAHDMLASPSDWPAQKTFLWDMLRSNRDLFYSKDMRAYMGYVRKQTAKYGFKGSRLAALQQIITFLEQHPADTRLEEIFSSLPVDDEYLRIITRDGPNGVPDEFYDIMGSSQGKRTKLKEILKSLHSREKEYGVRARLALSNEGVDWKAVSHAFRAAYQLIQLFTDGEMVLPLKKDVISFILPIKLGQVSWMECQEQLEILTESANSLATKSSFSESVDDARIDQLVLDISYEAYFGNAE